MRFDEWLAAALIFIAIGGGLIVYAALSPNPPQHGTPTQENPHG